MSLKSSEKCWAISTPAKESCVETWQLKVTTLSLQPGVSLLVRQKQMSVWKRARSVKGFQWQPVGKMLGGFCGGLGSGHHLLSCAVDVPPDTTSENPPGDAATVSWCIRWEACGLPDPLTYRKLQKGSSPVGFCQVLANTEEGRLHFAPSEDSPRGILQPASIGSTAAELMFPAERPLTVFWVKTKP